MSARGKGGYEDHYTNVGSSYDAYYFKYTEAIVAIISRTISFSSTDTVLDIGGGTGEIGHQLWKRFNFKQPVLCVDPSESMLEVAKQKEGVKTLQAAAEDFVSSLWDGSLFSRVLMVSCYHHFKDPGLVLEGIARMLTDDGVCIIARQGAENFKPFTFSKSLLHYQPSDFHAIVQLAQSKGLKGKVASDSEVYELKKQFCFEFVRSRMCSCHSDCTDQEIEEGISELMVKYKDSERIRMEHTMNMAIITKQ